jgi:hypothetical protein
MSVRRSRCIEHRVYWAIQRRYLPGVNCPARALNEVRIGNRLSAIESAFVVGRMPPSRRTNS